MGKRRNEKHESHNGGGRNTTTSSYGGDTNRYAVFEFADEDLLVETDSRKTLAKYDFLECFAQGTVSQQNDSGNVMADVDVTDTVMEDRDFRTDFTVSRSSLNYVSKAFPYLKHRDFEYSSCVPKSSVQGRRKPGGCTTEKKHNKVFYVDSDEDRRMKSRSLTSLFDVAKNEGSSKQSSEYGANADDCEAVVIVDPNYVKYGTIYYVKCCLTFSQRLIRLEGSTLCERKKPCCLEWSTFDILKIDYQQCVKANIVKFHLKSEDANMVEAGNGNSGAMELEFVVLDDPQWSKKQEEIKSLDLKYKAVWNTIMSECSFDERFEDVVYPEGDPDAVFISRRDIELLRPRTFINDTIVDFYMKYLVNKTKQEEKPRFHFFNTFFFRKLAETDRDISRAWEGREAFQRVRKWTRNVNLFEKDFIFIPVNYSLHWSLIVICYPGEVAKLRDNNIDFSPKIPCILHMDSISGSHRGFEHLIRSYLQEEWKERHNNDEEDISTRFLSLDFVEPQLPQQENLFDCGLFLLHYAELFLEQALTNSRKCFSCLSKDWFPPPEVSLKKRNHIRKLIHKIVEDNALKDPQPSCTNSVPENNVNESFLDIDESATNESFQPCKQLMPINQFSIMKLPMEEEALEKQKALIIDLQDEDCVDEVASSPMSTEDLAVCVVEDSEEENEIKNLKSRRLSFLTSSVDRIMAKFR